MACSGLTQAGPSPSCVRDPRAEHSTAGEANDRGAESKNQKPEFCRIERIMFGHNNILELPFRKTF